MISLKKRGWKVEENLKFIKISEPRNMKNEYLFFFQKKRIAFIPFPLRNEAFLVRKRTKNRTVNIEFGIERKF